MNWGYKILLVYIIFIVGMLYLVVKSSSQKMDLVTTDYYAKELKYQEKIDETSRTNSLSEAVKYEIRGDRLMVFFPKDFAGKKVTGTAEIYFPADENKDSKVNFNIQDSIQLISIPTTNKGLHELHLNWQAEGINYYYEKKIIL
jgi:nitrogen fixation protein FixH